MTEQESISCFLTLPRELRDLILEYALSDDDGPLAEDHAASSTCRIKRQTTGNERWEWSIQYDSAAPRSVYLNILSCNKQLKTEIEELVSRSRDSLPAKLMLVMAYPNLWPAWTNIPGPPDQIKTLDILIKANHMYHPAFMSNGPHNAILTTVFEVMKRYIHRGPHFARPSPLSRPLTLDTVRITLAPPVPFEDMTYVYGFPAQQLEILFNEFKTLMRRLCRSGLFSPALESFELSLVGNESTCVNVTSNIWDEADYTFFQNGGYCWDGGECLT